MEGAKSHNQCVLRWGTPAYVSRKWLDMETPMRTLYRLREAAEGGDYGRPVGVVECLSCEKQIINETESTLPQSNYWVGTKGLASIANPLARAKSQSSSTNVVASRASRRQRAGTAFVSRIRRRPVGHVGHAYGTWSGHTVHEQGTWAARGRHVVGARTRSAEPTVYSRQRCVDAGVANSRQSQRESAGCER